MKRLMFSPLALLLGTALCAPAVAGESETAHHTTAASPSAVARLSEAYGKLPLRFEANQGQADAAVKFLSRGSGYTLFLTPTEAVLSLAKPAAEESKPARATAAIGRAGASKAKATRPLVLRTKLVGANRSPEVSGVDELAGKSNYLIGADPAKWQLGVPNYGGVRYRAVYPGIDLVYRSGNQREVEYDFLVAPGADPSAIRLRFEGARKLRLDAAGNLVLATGSGEVIHRAPVVYQTIDGERRPIRGGFRKLARNDVGFVVGSYDRTKPLTIDPTLVYSTYLGGSFFDLGQGIAVDGSGNAYVTGATDSTDFPTANALQSSSGGVADAFVAKLDAAGSQLLYSTYLGGSGSDAGIGIAVDGSANAYVTGQTESTNFPTANALQSSFAGGDFDGFVAKLDPAGSQLLYSTYLGGSNDDFGIGIAADGSGSAYVTGGTFSTDFPTANALQSGFGGSEDAFIAKIGGAACGNGVLDPGEQCDDGNAAAGDCCSATCQFEANDTVCDDANACTFHSACNGAGACVAVGTTVVCTPLDQCHDAGTCDPATGQCSNPAKADGTPCNDGSSCTGPDTCTAGVCGGPATGNCCVSDADCDDGDSCTTDRCTEPSGSCSNTPIPLNPLDINSILCTIQELLGG
jgi:cysteine-rich repeat protein